VLNPEIREADFRNRELTTLETLVCKYKQAISSNDEILEIWQENASSP